MSKPTENIHIGTSGWHYMHWIGNFYPADLTAKDFLSFFIQHFKTVELNNTFYHLPLKQTFVNWYKNTPDDFIFAVKASRYITHIKRLTDPKESSGRFLKLLSPLKEKLGPILFQLPPRWHSNPERLDTFLKAMPKKFRYTFELRDTTWFNDDIYTILKKYNAAFCMYDFNGTLSPQILTADFVYVRFHGPDGKYRGQYSSAFLNAWAKNFLTWRSQGIKAIYCYFDNDDSGYATQDAKRLYQAIASQSKPKHS